VADLGSTVKAVQLDQNALKNGLNSLQTNVSLVCFSCFTLSVVLVELKYFFVMHVCAAVTGD
jgi:hypothetical protein